MFRRLWQSITLIFGWTTRCRGCGVSERDFAFDGWSRNVPGVCQACVSEAEDPLA
jgi:hypothetical protein